MFDQLYTDNICNRSQLYPGVLEGLKRLQQTGIELACVTNKAAHFTEVLIDEIGLGSFFQLVVSGDTTARLKPDPMPLQYAADYFAFRSTDCLMVGDSSNDVEAARNANFKVACVPYGYNHGEDIRISEPDLVVNSIDELADLFVINAKPGSAVSC